MTINELTMRYGNIPQELKSLKRWVGYKVETLADGKTTKRPYNSLSGRLARVNDSLTWSTFNLALSGCVKYGFDGIGFVLGDGIFGVDLDNHGDIDENEFKKIANEFVAELDSYTEWSQSGKGIHIMCKGKLPEGSRRKGCVEMYDANRFFAFTGRAIRNKPLQDRESEIKPLWEKYVFTPMTSSNAQPQYSRMDSTRYETLKLSDEEILQTVANSRQSSTFFRYYDDGDIGLQGGDASKADLAFCSMLAFWCNKDISQMDRIFRNSGLMRPKWDEHRGVRTYGEITLESACRGVGETFTKTKLKDRVIVGKKEETAPTVEKIEIKEEKKVVAPEKEVETVEKIEYISSLDDEGEPIFRIKKRFGSYPLSDTGNALKFYDYFGDLFRYNVTDKVFMFWTGKMWIKDTKQIIRKYANKLIEIMKNDDDAMSDKIQELSNSGRVDEAKRMEAVLKESRKNTARVANKAGKDAMLSEFQTLKDVPIKNEEFDKDNYLLNTQSGVVDLRTGKISAFDRNLLMSRITQCGVSFERSNVWENFLYGIFDNDNYGETKELVETLQTCLGYSLTGSVVNQCLFVLNGDGSNGKSTLMETIAKIMGTYSESIKASLLIAQKHVNQTDDYVFAGLQGVRCLITGETGLGNYLAEEQVKVMTGGEKLNGRFPFGNPFSYYPVFKVWMSTNHLPNIKGTDNGIWRRIFVFPFDNIITDDRKDLFLPQKLMKDADKILGWCIKGALMYQKNLEDPKIKGLKKPKQVKKAVDDYRQLNDQIGQFMDDKCIVSETAYIGCDEMYEAYKVWASNNTDFVKKESQFANELTKKMGIEKRKDNRGVQCYYGIRLAGVHIYH